MPSRPRAAPSPTPVAAAPVAVVPVALALAATLAAARLHAPAPAAAAPSAAFSGAAGRIHLDLPRAPAPPVLDGAIGDGEWAAAAVLDSFVQSAPVEGVPDSLGTTCRVMHDATHLYVAFRCPDRPGGVRAPLCPRDDVAQGDFVGVALDTYLERRRAMIFLANPRGVQEDAVETDEGGYDTAPDFLYRAEGRVTAAGYEVEMAIPFRSLRFPPADPLAFGFQAARYVQRTDQSLFFAPITDAVPSLHAQYGTLRGIAGVRPGLAIQWIPYGTATAGAVERDARLAWGRTGRRAGFDLKAALGPNVIADGAVNPDFSQVEADAGVIEVNERFDIFYPEKRPFFLEGTDLFRGPLQAVYTRRIADPRLGVKLTGKAGATQFGALHAVDRRDGFPDAGVAGNADEARWTVARVKRDVPGRGYVGGLFTNRAQGNRSNAVAGADGQAHLGGPWTATAQGLLSWSDGSDGTEPVTDPFGMPLAAAGATAGHAASLEVEGESPRAYVSAWARDLAPDFRADLGFFQRAGVTEAGTFAEWRVLGGPGDRFARIEAQLEWSGTWARESRAVGLPLDDVLEAAVEVRFPSNAEVGVGGFRSYTRFEERVFDGHWRGYAWADLRQFEAVQGSAFASWGDAVIFREAARGRALRMNGDLALRAGAGLRAVLSWDATVLWRAAGGSRFADVVIPRLVVTRQFTRELSLRAIGELRSQREYDAAGAMSASEREATLDLLAGWQLHPGTVVYAGYGSGLDGPALDATRPRRASLFLKASRLFQW